MKLINHSKYITNICELAIGMKVKPTKYFFDCFHNYFYYLGAKDIVVTNIIINNDENDCYPLCLNVDGRHVMISVNRRCMTLGDTNDKYLFYR